MTKEEAERRPASEIASLRQHQRQPLQHHAGESHHEHPHPLPPATPALDGGMPTSPISPPQSPTAAGVEMVMRKAQKQVDKTTDNEKRRGRCEEGVPERTLGTTERGNQTTLPVVKEVRESCNASDSLGRSSGAIRQVSRSTAGDGAREEAVEDEIAVDEKAGRAEEDEKTQKVSHGGPGLMDPEKSDEIAVDEKAG